MLFAHIVNFIYKLFSKTEKTYGSDLERYITSKNPQSTYDVEYWARRFDDGITNKRTAGWPL